MYKVICLIVFFFLIYSCKEDPTPIIRTEHPDGNTSVQYVDTIPKVYISTEQNILDEPKVRAEMRIIRNNALIFESGCGIEIRGSSSQFFPKKSYGIEFWNDNDMDIEHSLFGMPMDEDWILYAPYSDKSLMRNVLMYELSNEMNKYASRTQWVEAYINEEYLGVYVLMEKIKRSKDRVDVSKLNPDEVNGEDITGGYILKIDKSTGNDVNDPGNSSNYSTEFGFKSEFDASGQLSFDHNTWFQYEYPKQERIYTGLCW